MKITAWGIRQAIWGSDRTEEYWFSSKEAREEYAANHDHFDRIRARKVEADEVFKSYADWVKSKKEEW